MIFPEVSASFSNSKEEYILEGALPQNSHSDRTYEANAISAPKVVSIPKLIAEGFPLGDLLSVVLRFRCS